jgi:hypothetical protein
MEFVRLFKPIHLQNCLTAEGGNFKVTSRKASWVVSRAALRATLQAALRAASFHPRLFIDVFSLEFSSFAARDGGEGRDGEEW